MQARLFDILEERGATISRLTSSRVPAVPQLKSLPTFMDELDAAAAWAQSKLQQSPHAQLGIVMPGLEVLREQVHHRLGSMMATEAFLGANADAHIPFHLSLGRPLQQWAPVHH